MRIALANGWVAARDGLADLARLATSASKRGADLLVMPALGVGSPKGILCDAPEIDELCMIAESTGVGLVFGYLEACPTGRFSAAQLIGADGRALANYRCTHTDKTDALDDGHWLTIVRHGDRRLGLLLDGDIAAPEVSRALVLGGADTLLHLASKTYLGEELARVRAWENRCSMLSISDGNVFAVDTGGHRLAMVMDTPALKLVDLPPSEPPNNDTRRPELYAQIALAGC